MKKIAILALVMGATFSTFAIVAKRPPNATPLSGDWEVVQMPYAVKTSRPQLNFNGGNRIVFLSAGCQTIEGTYEENRIQNFDYAYTATTKLSACSRLEKNRIATMKSLLAKATRYEVNDNEVHFFNGKKRLFTMRKKVYQGKSENGAKANPLNADFRIISHKESGVDVERNMQKTSIIFSEKDGRVSANVGCNSISGTLSIRGNMMEISQMISTKMGCQEELAGMEASVIDNLSNAKSFNREANHLYIYNEAGRLIMFLEQQSFEND